MKTVFINGSPKKKFSASAYFLDVLKFFVKGKKVKETLRTPSDHERILNTLKDADSVVFCLPLYVDGVPSHVLSFMKKMEVFCKENSLQLNVYVISNGGFIEGKQNQALLQVFENFCKRSNIKWCGGIGIGGGVMLNVLRIVFLIQAGILLLNIVLSGVQFSNWLPMDALWNFVTQALMITFFNLGVFWYSLRMGIALNKGHLCGNKYTRIMIPSFIFILFADIFFVIISFFEGGIFRGWFSKKI
ncbi:MAG: hypothetical protein IJN54_05185 [Lachnospiraceae bacterium]|nr:hypothetical protein [Lachnospiraceae bacterium]